MFISSLRSSFYKQWAGTITYTKITVLRDVTPCVLCARTKFQTIQAVCTFWYHQTEAARCLETLGPVTSRHISENVISHDTWHLLDLIPPKVSIRMQEFQIWPHNNKQSAVLSTRDWLKHELLYCRQRRALQAVKNTFCTAGNCHHPLLLPVSTTESDLYHSQQNINC
jgi:hypothetical protein